MRINSKILRKGLVTRKVLRSWEYDVFFRDPLRVFFLKCWHFSVAQATRLLRARYHGNLQRSSLEKATEPQKRIAQGYAFSPWGGSLAHAIKNSIELLTGTWNQTTNEWYIGSKLHICTECYGISLSRTREITGICWEFGFHVLGEFGLFRNTEEGATCTTHVLSFWPRTKHDEIESSSTAADLLWPGPILPYSIISKFGLSSLGARKQKFLCLHWIGGMKSKKEVLPGSRTQNPRFRRPMPYPLGQQDIHITEILAVWTVHKRNNT